MKKDLVGFNFRGLNQRRKIKRNSSLQARYTVPCNSHSPITDLLTKIHHWSQGTKDHALTNMCSFKPAGIKGHYQVRNLFSSQNKYVGIILLKVRRKK